MSRVIRQRLLVNFTLLTIRGASSLLEERKLLGRGLSTTSQLLCEAPLDVDSIGIRTILAKDVSLHLIAMPADTKVLHKEPSWYSGN